MRVCIVVAEPRPPIADRPRRPSQLELNEQMRVEDALLGLGRDAEQQAGATVVALIVGGRSMRGGARHALTAGVSEAIRLPVDDLAAWSDADAARLVAAAIRHVGCDVAVVGAEGLGGWDRLAGQIAVYAGMALCTSVVAFNAGEPLITDHELEHERVQLQHTAAVVTTMARPLLATAPCFAYPAVVASVGRSVTTLDPAALGVARPDQGGRIAYARLDDAPRRREVVSGADGVDPAVHFLEVIGALR